MKVIEEKTYRQWQSRNTNQFKSLTRTEQKEVRNQGYCNTGWEQVQNSWRILYKFNRKVSSLFEHKLQNGDIVGAIDISLMDAESAQKIAQEAVNILEVNQKHFKKVADEVLAKYPLL